MKFLILTTDYSDFLDWLYVQHPGLENQSYEEQMRVRVESLFSVADFYSSNLRKLSYKAYDIHANNEFMQKAWAKEHGIPIQELEPAYQDFYTFLQSVRNVAVQSPLRYLKPIFRPFLKHLDNQPKWFYKILAEQIKFYKPNILLNQAMVGISSQFLKEMKPYVKLLVGQHAATRLPDNEDFSCYDLIISSFLPTVEYFRQRGIPAELHRLGFEPRVLSYLNNGEDKVFDVTFIGSFFRKVHDSRVRLLEFLCVHIPNLKIWGSGISQLSPNSPIRKFYEGQAWGLRMYQILHRSKITLNHHGDIPPYANNCRLFESTGVGTLLITDWKTNLHEMFEVGKEVVAYHTTEECAELIKYYLEHEDERESIAKVGQQRTFREYTYYHRMQELVKIINKYL